MHVHHRQPHRRRARSTNDDAHELGGGVGIKTTQKTGNDSDSATADGRRKAISDIVAALACFGFAQYSTPLGTYIAPASLRPCDEVCA